jgi:hypothetical protein
MRIALSIKAKNGYIYQYMKEHGLNAQQMAKEIKISLSTLREMLNFKWSYLTINRNHIFRKGLSPRKSKVITKVEEFFQLPISEICPKPVDCEALQQEHVIVKNVDLLSLNDIKPYELTYDPSEPEIVVIKAVHDILGTLTPHEEQVLRLTFGIPNYEKFNTEDCVDGR